MKHPTNEKGSRVPGRGSEPESGRREVRVKRGSWLVSLPRFIRDRLRLTEAGPVYWHRGRPGEVVMTLTEKRHPGAPDTKGLVRDLADAHRTIERLRQRDEAKLRSMYAEGYALGYQTGVEVTMKPHQRRANEVRRRKLWAHAFPAAAADGRMPCQPGAMRPVEAVSSPVLEGKPPVKTAARSELEPVSS